MGLINRLLQLGRKLKDLAAFHRSFFLSSNLDFIARGQLIGALTGHGHFVAFDNVNGAGKFLGHDNAGGTQSKGHYHNCGYKLFHSFLLLLKL